MKLEDALLHLKKQADQSGVLRQAVVAELGSKIYEMSNLLSGVIGSGGKILVAGNGGSASMASHFVAELVVRLTASRTRQSLPAIALASDLAVITAAANDFGYENIFARQVEGLGNRGDMLMVLSTSGNSKNLIRAVKTAKDKNILTTALLGGNGGKLATMIERPLTIPHPSTQAIQEEHLFILHQLVEMIEKDLFA
jgi:D-sedoheptulose 7-phosphate isomerase